MIFRSLTKEEYSSFLVTNPMNNFLQSPKMDTLAKSKKQEVHYVGVLVDDKIVAGARLVATTSHFGRKIFYSPRGLILDYRNKKLLTFFTKQLKKYIKKNKGFILIIDPLVSYRERDIDGNIIPNGENNKNVITSLKKLGFIHRGFTTGFDMATQMRFVFILDLENKTEEQVYSDFKQNAKRLITKCEKNNIEIKELTYDELEEFKKLTESSSTRHNFQDKTLEYYQTMYNQFNDSNEIKFLVARIDLDKYLENLNDTATNAIKEITRLGQNMNAKSAALIDQLNTTLSKTEEEVKEIEEYLKEDGPVIDLAAAMFITYGDEVIYVFGGNDNKYIKFNAQYLIQWYMIKYGIENGFKRYNFFGISGIFDPNDPDYGVYDFKKKFNGYVIEYIGEFELPVTKYYHLEKFLSKIKNKGK